MNKDLLFEYEMVTSKKWKQHIQFLLDGKDYAATFNSKNNEEFELKPFYHADIDNLISSKHTEVISEFKKIATVFVNDIDKSIFTAKKYIENGATIIRCIIPNPLVDIEQFILSFSLEIELIIQPLFLDTDFISKITRKNTYALIDPIHKVSSEGNYFNNLTEDFLILNKLVALNKNTFRLFINTTTYQNAGASITQQIAYTLAHLNEYLNRIKKTYSSPIYIQLSVETNLFFEISKIKTIKWLAEFIIKKHQRNNEIRIITTPSKRNKWAYNWEINQHKSYIECLSSALSGVYAIENTNASFLTKKTRTQNIEFSLQELKTIEKHIYSDKKNFSNDSYYLESLSNKMIHKSFELFKNIERKGGFITQLIKGTIQDNIKTYANKLQEKNNFDSYKLITKENIIKNKSINDLYPFIKFRKRKTLIKPIIENRLYENFEKTILKELENETP